MLSSVQLAFSRGWRFSVPAAARTIRSVYVTLTPCDFSTAGSIASRAAFSAPASTSLVTKKCGTVVQLCVVRSAISRPIVVTVCGSCVAVDSYVVSGFSRAVLWRLPSADVLRCRENIVRQNLPAWSRPSHLAEIDAMLLRKPTRLGRDAHRRRRRGLARCDTGRRNG